MDIYVVCDKCGKPINDSFLIALISHTNLFLILSFLDTHANQGCLRYRFVLMDCTI
jgi:hypothetical protein